MQNLSLLAIAIVILRGAHANKTSNDAQGESVHQVQNNHTQDKAAALTKTPRFTWEGCLCMERWRLLGYEFVEVSNYCGNPDNDANGEWCFVVDSTCQPHARWGYCAPAPLCLVGDSVLVPALKGQLAARLEAYRDQSVIVRWPDGSINVIGMQNITTLDGRTCIYQITTTPTAEGTELTTTGSMPTSTTTTASATMQTLRGSQRRVAYDLAKHGPALSVRFDLDFANVLVNQATFKANLISTAMLVLNEPYEAVEVLAIMPGSVIVAIGVVPSACSFAEQTKTIACTRALINARQRWEIAIYAPSSFLSKIVGTVDPLFPTMLDAAECSRRSLACPWITESAKGNLGCGGSNVCTQDHVYPERDPWWFMSLIAFAGATPTCLCLGLVSLKGCIRACRYFRHRRHVRTLRADVFSLPRVEVHAEDLHLGEDWLCSICLGEMSPEIDLLLLPCKHTLHFDCGMEWLERKLMCPMCRSPCRVRDCAIYTTPTFVVNFDGKEEPVSVEDVVDAPTCTNYIGPEEPPSPRSSLTDADIDQDQQCNLLLVPLPNVISDEEGNRPLS